MEIGEYGTASDSAELKTPQVDISAPSVQTPPDHRAPPPNLLPVWIVDARPPFPRLAFYSLIALPRAGDKILVDVGRSRSTYQVVEINFDPFANDTHVMVLCRPYNANETLIRPTQNDDLKKQFDDYMKSHLEFVSKAEALTRAIILLGYAGIFAIWSFVKDVISPLGATYAALLIGISLMIYISYNVLIIVHSARIQFKTAGFPTENPAEFFRLINEFNLDRRKRLRRDSAVWLAQITLTVGFGYAGALLLLYNCIAKILHFAP